MTHSLGGGTGAGMGSLPVNLEFGMKMHDENSGIWNRISEVSISRTSRQNVAYPRKVSWVPFRVFCQLIWMQPSQHKMPKCRHLAHLEDSRGIPGPRHGDLLDRAKPEGFGHCGRAVQLCEAKNVQTSGLIRVANCRLWDNNLVSNCMLFMPNKLALRHSFTPLCKQISSYCAFAR